MVCKIQQKLEKMIQNEGRDNDLMSRLVKQFRSKSQYENFVHEAQEKFEINTYRFQQLSCANAKKCYIELKEKYKKHIFEHSPRAWHENERKIFVWFLLALLKSCQQNHRKIEEEDWKELSSTFFSKDILLLKYQWNSIQKNRKRHSWTQHEDQIIKSCDFHTQNNNWNEIAKEIFFQTEGKSFKSSKQCRERWQNHLDNRIKKKAWQPHEDLTIMKYVIENGKKWSKIVEELKNTRTEHMIKNRFKSLLAKAQNSFKTQQRKKLKENAMIQFVIEEINSKKIIIQKKSSLQNGCQNKEIVEKEIIPEIKLSFLHKKSSGIHGLLERNENGDFITESFSTRSSSIPNIFQSKSPALKSFGSVGFFYAHSILTPQSSVSTPTSDPFGINSSFQGHTESWDRFLKTKQSFASESSVMSKFLRLGRRQENEVFSMELGSLENGEKIEMQASGIPNNYLPYLQEKLQINQRPPILGDWQSNDGQEFTSTLFKNFVVHTDHMSKSQMYEGDDKI